MSILSEEIRKIIKRPSVFAIMAALLCLNIYYIKVYRAEDPSKSFPGYWEVTELLQGELTDEKIAFVMQTMDHLKESSVDEYSSEYYSGFALVDYGYFQAHRQEMERIYFYNSTINEIKASAEQNIVFYRSIDNQYMVRVSEKTIEVYGTRVITEYYDLSGQMNYLSYDFSSLLVIVMAILIASPLFSSERESQTDQIVLSSFNGRHRTALAKKHAVFIIVVLIALVFYATDLLCFDAFTHLYGWNAPIYQIEQFQLTPLTISVWQYALLSIFLKLIGIILICQLIALFSSLSHSTVFVFMISVSILAFCIATYGHATLDLVNPVTFLCNRDFLVIPSFTDFFGYPVFTFYFVLLSGIVGGLITYLLIHPAYLYLYDRPKIVDSLSSLINKPRKSINVKRGK